VDRHLALLHAAETTRRSYRQAAGKHIHPLLGRLRISAITPEILDKFDAELLRCRDHCHHPAPEHVCQPLHPATVRKIHYLLSGAYHRLPPRGALGLARPQPHTRRRPAAQAAPRTATRSHP
jgi:integrase